MCSSRLPTLDRVNSGAAGAHVHTTPVRTASASSILRAPRGAGGRTIGRDLHPATAPRHGCKAHDGRCFALRTACPRPSLPSPRARRARGVLLGLAASLLLGACALPPPYRAPANHGVRFSDVETITLVPPLVSVAAMSSGNIEQEVQEWSDAANENAREAVRANIEALGKTFVPYAGKHPAASRLPPSAPTDVNDAPPGQRGRAELAAVRVREGSDPSSHLRHVPAVSGPDAALRLHAGTRSPRPALGHPGRRLPA